MSTVLSIAGFDPSAGAGVLADVKTCEAHGVYACGVVSALTYQNERSFGGVRWLPRGEIVQQIEPLLETTRISAVKFGLIEDLSVIETVLDILPPGTPAVWDPVTQASAGFWFHRRFEPERLHPVLTRLALVTPNWEEARVLAPGAPSSEEAARKLSAACPVLLKGGHADGAQSVDTLFHRGTSLPLAGERISGAAKHGSGCVFAAAAACGIAEGLDLTEACRRAKAYTLRFLTSAPGLLGRHQPQRGEER